LREVIFIRRANPKLETWEGHKLTPEEARALSGIRTVRFLDEYEAILASFMMYAKYVI